LHSQKAIKVFRGNANDCDEAGKKHQGRDIGNTPMPRPSVIEKDARRKVKKQEPEVRSQKPE